MLVETVDGPKVCVVGVIVAYEYGIEGANVLRQDRRKRRVPQGPERRVVEPRVGKESFLLEHNGVCGVCDVHDTALLRGPLHRHLVRRTFGARGTSPMIELSSEGESFTAAEAQRSEQEVSPPKRKPRLHARPSRTRARRVGRFRSLHLPSAFSTRRAMGNESQRKSANSSAVARGLAPSLRTARGWR